MRCCLKWGKGAVTGTSRRSCARSRPMEISRVIICFPSEACYVNWWFPFVVSLPSLTLDWIRWQGVQLLPPFVVYPGLTTQWLLTWRWTGETLGPLWTRSQPWGTTGELHVCGWILGLACFHTWPRFFEILSPDSWSLPTSFDYSFLVSSLILINRCPANADSLSQTFIQGSTPLQFLARFPKTFLFSMLWCGCASAPWTSHPPSLGSIVCLPCFHHSHRWISIYELSYL